MAKNIFELPKTLSLALEPTLDTSKKLSEFKKLESDFEVIAKTVVVKKLIDKFHLAYINDCLAKIKEDIDWTALFNALYDKDEPAMKKERKACMAAIQSLYSTVPGFDYLMSPTPSKLIKEKLIPQNPDEPALLVQAGYLQDFQTNRQTLYGTQKGSIAYRIVFDNMYLYTLNAVAWSTLKVKYPDVAERILLALKKEDITEDIETLFTPDGYRRCLTQRGIAIYNTLLNGFTDDAGIYHYGICKMVNDLRANNETKDMFKAKEWPTFAKLKKMILADTTETLSFVPKRFHSDEEMFASVHEFYKQMSADNVLGTISGAVEALRAGVITAEDIVIVKDRLSGISNSVFGKWDIIDNALQRYSSECFKTKTAAKKFNAEKTISMAKLQEIMKMYGYEQNILDFWTKLNLTADLAALETAVCQLEKNLGKAEIKDRKELLPDTEKAFKNLSNTVADLKLLLGGKITRNKYVENIAFKFIEEELLTLSQNCHFLFNTTRYWVTRKPYETQKIELSFGFPDFGNGFAESVIAQKGCMIFRRGREYFLGVLNTQCKPKLDSLYENVPANSEMFSMFSYTLRAMAISGVIFSKANNGMFRKAGLTDEIIEGYKNKLYKTDTAFLHKLIRFAIVALGVYPSWRKIKWNLGEPENYGSWKEFCDAVSEQSVTVELHQCNEDMLRKLVANGNMFLFKITGHGMKKYEKGLPTKDKMADFFIRAVENLQKDDETSVKLLNSCDVYYRPASIKTPFVHRKGDVLVDKKDVYGNPIPGRIYKQLFHYYTHGKKDFAKLTEDAQKYILDKLVITKVARFDLVKDRRFTVDTFMLHIPVVINSGAVLTLDSDDNINTALDIVNDEANEMYAKSGNVIGLTRGANHLVSYCVVNKDTGVIEEGDFDVVEERDDEGNVKESQNYKLKYVYANAERGQRAKTWQEIGDISGMLDGYLKNVVRDVIELSDRYQALIAVEDMSEPLYSKSIKSMIDAGTYRKFEATLIDALACYVPDKRNMGKICQYSIGNRGVKDNQGQNGRVVFVKTARLQGTDPVTGFYNLFGGINGLDSKNNLKKFFESFTSIEAKGDAVEFAFNYSDFKLTDIRNMKDSWKIRIEGERFSFEVNPNDKMNRRELVVRYPAKEILDFVAEKTGGKIMKDIKSVIVSDDNRLEDLLVIKKALFLALKPRQCAIVNGEEVDKFVSVACDDKNKTFISGTLDKYPSLTDTVLAYNIVKQM